VGARLLSLLAAVALSGCGGDGYPLDGRQTLKGFVVVGFEVWAFQQCNSASLIWVDIQGNERGVDKLGPLLAQSCESCVKMVYVELDAVVSDRCPCGHLGKYTHELAIEEVLAASAMPPPACPHLDPRFPR
jgi:hypothetical protein